MAATDGSSSSSGSSSTYDVFLSFRGEDTRNSFTGFLYRDLKREGINVFMDSEGLWGGEEIKPALLNAIQRSKISILVFSKGYADSKWCLMELVEIVRCHTSNGQKVLPIFLDVEPRDVRNQTGSFEGSFLKHKEIFDTKIIQSWKDALTLIGERTGFELKQVNGNQPKLVELVINWALSELRTNLLGDVKNAVGLDARVDDLLSLLNASSNDVRFVGICGIGGIGKTCIAAALFNRISNNFDVKIFLGNVREEALQPNGSVQLQQKLIYSASKRKKDICNVQEGCQLIKEQLREKKVLLIIDDVDSYSQLKDLAIEFNLFGPGSRIIITSRDEHILNVAKVDDDNIYWPDELDNAQSLRLFSLHAFSMEQPLEDYKQLSHNVVKRAGGLPLTLEVLGCAFCGIRDKRVWESMLKKLNRIPPKDVQKKLRISYDNLEDDEKSIFLDAACFFIGWPKPYLIHLWEARGFDPMSAIQKLTQRSLLKFVSRSECFDLFAVLKMHDQIRDMGRGIVFEENPTEPGKRSRLWSVEEILKLLEDHTGTQMIEGIYLAPDQFFPSAYLNTDDFARMSKLRYLCVCGESFEGDFSQLPSNLSCFVWTGCSFEILPANFYHKRLVCLDLRSSQIRQAWTKEPQNENMRFQKLKSLIIQDCQNLSKSPVFSWFPCLEFLDLGRCSKFVDLHDSIGDLNSLVSLHLASTKIEKLPDCICRLSSLQILSLPLCASLKNLPDSIGDLKSLVHLFLDGTDIKELPNSICELRSLKFLFLNSCSSLKNLPESIGDLRSLVQLCLDGTRISRLPNSIGRLSSLELLSLKSCSSLKTLPESIGDLKSLIWLLLDGTKIEELPNSIGRLSSLKSLCLKSCSSLETLPESIGDLESLIQLRLDGTKIEELPNSISKLSSLQELHTKRCPSSLKRLPELIGDLKSLVKLHLCSTKIEELPNSIGRLSSLEILCLCSCSSFETLPESAGDLKCLVSLHLCSTKIEELPNSIGRLSSLEILCLSSCSSLETLPESIGDLKSLIKLCLKETGIKELPESIGRLSSLKMLDLNLCKSLQKLPESIGDLNSLVGLILDGSNIKELPINGDGGMLEKLEVLRVRGCSNLVNQPVLWGRMKCIRIIDLRGTSILLSRNDFPVLPSLVELKIGNQLESSLPLWISGLPLEKLKLQGYTRLESLPKLPPTLTYLKVKSCSSLLKLPDLSSLKNLRILILDDCKRLEEIGGLEGTESLEQFDVYDCDAITYTPKKMHGQGTLLVEESSRSDSLNVNDGRYKGLILCLVFSFVNQQIWSTSEEGDEGEPPRSEGDGEPPRSDGEPRMIQLNCTASIRQQDRLTKSNIRMGIEGVEYTEGDIIYIHHFKGFDWFGLPLEGKDAIEDIQVSTVVPTEHQEYIGYDCEVKFWKLLLESTENKQQMLDPESSARMVADFFDWPGISVCPKAESSVKTTDEISLSNFEVEGSDPFPEKE